MRYAPAVVCVLLLAACDSKPTQRTQPAPVVTAQPPTPAPAPSKSALDLILEADTLAAAIELARPEMTDEFGKLSPGASNLTSWATRKMGWSDVGIAKDETTHALVEKDADAERGKRLCATGTIVQITAIKAQVGRVYKGIIGTPAQKLYQFMAVGSSGALVAGSRARFCGVVTGRYDYSNSMGGTGHAIQLVGMFDLPENGHVVIRAPTPPAMVLPTPDVYGKNR